MAAGSAETFDGIVIGAGHNGLVLQAYLCRAGLRVLALERSPAAGGGLCTIEDNRCPGFYHNVHAVFLRGLAALPWYRDLALEARGVRAVQPADGRRVGARAFIASSLNPQQTLLDLLGGEGLDAATRERARTYRYQTVGPLFSLHLALEEPPRYAAGAAAGPGDDVGRAFLTLLGLRGPEAVYALYADHAAGRPAAVPVIWGTVPTVHDPGQAPPGKHTAFMWQKVPYALHGRAANWDAAKEGHAAAVLSRWREFAPNLTDRAIRNRFALSPLDTERRFPNMAAGDLGVGWMGPGQRGADRPLPGQRPYRTPTPGLYLCGACTHPGGNITGLPGYNAALAIAEDLGITPWWNPPDLEEQWSRLS